VLLGEVRLDCTIDAQKPGRQTLVLTKGGGLEFDAVVSPIVDGTAKLLGPDKGGTYRFTSHLMQPATGKLTPVGEVKITELETKVSVDVTGYQQKGGPGTTFTFTAGQMAQKGIYIEFAGQAETPAGERYAFKVNLGSATGGRGEVTPANANHNTDLVAKAVVVEAPMTTVVESVPATTSFRRLP
jgi:hypothetical protein